MPSGLYPDFQPPIKESIWSSHREKYLISSPLEKKYRNVYLFSSKKKKITTGKKQDFYFSMLLVADCKSGVSPKSRSRKYAS